MRKSLFVFVTALSLIAFSASAQNRKLKQVMHFEIPGDGGSNGASIAYDPAKKLYYAPMAGNAAFTLAIFNAAGKRISEEDQATIFDVRGMWYNPAMKAICGNAYADGGWVRYQTNTKGIPTETTALLEGQYQPTEQSVGVYDAKSGMVYFLSGAFLVAYDKKGEEKTRTMLTTPALKNLDMEAENYQTLKDGEELPSGYNTTAPIFTGLPGAEIGLLNVEEKQVELYNRKTGKLTQKWKLPEEATCYDSFNFAYANGMVWLFDKDTRSWTAYK
jgi:hypothetical protein